MTVEIPLSTSGMIALVDSKDAELVNQYKWQARKSGQTFYASRGYGSHKLPKKTMTMHRLIMDASAGYDVDHINGNGLDNRRENLRVCTRAENARNRTVLSGRNKSGIAGVHWHKDMRKWVATININKKQKTIGYYKTVVLAGEARRSAELEHYGKFATTVQTIDASHFVEPEPRPPKKLSATNTSGVRGVYWDKRNNRWMAVLRLPYKSVNLGRFLNKEDAIAKLESARLGYSNAA